MRFLSLAIWVKIAKFKLNACVSVALSIQITKFKSHQYELRAVSPNLMLAKVTHYTVSCKNGDPQIGDPGFPFSWENVDPGPYFHNILGTPGSLFSQEIGDPFMRMGTPSSKTLLDIDCAALSFVACCLALYPSIHAVCLWLQVCTNTMFNQWLI